MPGVWTCPDLEKNRSWSTSSTVFNGSFKIPWLLLGISMLITCSFFWKCSLCTVNIPHSVITKLFIFIWVVGQDTNRQTNRRTDRRIDRQRISYSSFHQAVNSLWETTSEDYWALLDWFDETVSDRKCPQAFSRIARKANHICFNMTGIT